MSSFSIWHWIILIIILGIPLTIIFAVVFLSSSRNGELKNTWKFRTVVFTILAFVIPLWLITFPLFLFLAYRSYIAGDETLIDLSNSNFDSTSQTKSSIPTQSNADQLASLHELLKSGALTQNEFDIEKRKILAT